MQLEILPHTFAIHRLQPDASIPPEIFKASVFSMMKTMDELSIVVPEAISLASQKVDGGWAAFRVAGTLDFSLTGILASIANPLADAEISIFALSTYDTDYVMVKKDQFARAQEVLKQAGFQFS